MLTGQRRSPLPSLPSQSTHLGWCSLTLEVVMVSLMSAYGTQSAAMYVDRIEDIPMLGQIAH